MAVPFSNTKLRVPKGFQNILECLAREVLRSQPDNIHEFAAAYFEKMLKVRTETGHDPAVHGAKLEDRNYNNESFKKRSVDPSDPQQQQAAVTIQTQFRQHSAKGEVQTMREEDAATRIQAGFRGFIDREQVRSMKGDESGGQAEEEVDIDLNDPEVEKAAIKIQAGFKGFKARKDVHGQDEGQAADESAEAPRPASAGSDKNQKTQEAEEEVDIDLNDPEVANAALKIQAGFRGHQARRELGEKAVPNAEQATTATSPPNTTRAPTSTAASAAPVLPAKQQEEEEDLADIDLGDPDLACAALKIQAGFRGIQSRKKLQEKKTQREEKQQKASPTPEPEQVTPSVVSAAAEEEEVDIDLTDPDVEKAAVKIQAGFKGLKARKGLKQKADEAPPAEAEPAAVDQTPAKTEEEEVDIDLEDPATEKAALKIQAGFRGYQTRKDMSDKTQEQQQEEKKEEVAEEKKEEEEVDIDLEDPEVEKAAMKIQAGFKGFKARKELQDKKGADDTVDGGAPAQAEEEKPADESPGEEQQVAASEEETQPKEVVESEGQEVEGQAAEDKGEEVKGQEEEEVDIDLEDPEVEKAALKIQAGFKGFKSRKAQNKPDETDGGQ